IPARPSPRSRAARSSAGCTCTGASCVARTWNDSDGEEDPMNAPISRDRRFAPEALAALVGELASRFGERAVANASIREQHGHGEGLADAALPDLVVYPHTNEEVAEVVRACAAHRVPVIAFGVGTSLEGHVAAIHG